jgi:hypothetical protein
MKPELFLLLVVANSGADWPRHLRHPFLPTGKIPLHWPRSVGCVIDGPSFADDQWEGLMRFWRWIVDFFMGKPDETPPDDVRFYETLRRDQLEQAARDAARAPRE